MHRRGHIAQISSLHAYIIYSRNGKCAANGCDPCAGDGRIISPCILFVVAQGTRGSVTTVVRFVPFSSHFRGFSHTSLHSLITTFRIIVLFHCCHLAYALISIFLFDRAESQDLNLSTDASWRSFIYLGDKTLVS